MDLEVSLAEFATRRSLPELHRLSRNFQTDTTRCSVSVATRSLVDSGNGLRLHEQLSRTRGVLILDDATSAVDPSKEHEIRSAMSTVMDGRTTLVIAHRQGPSQWLTTSSCSMKDG